jgi:hypothetical protein
MSGNGHELGLAAEKGRRKMVLPLGLCPLIARGDKLTVGTVAGQLGGQRQSDCRSRRCMPDGAIFFNRVLLVWLPCGPMVGLNNGVSPNHFSWPSPPLQN